MWRYTLSSLRAAKGRLLLTAAAIALGVGAVSGTFVIIDSASAAADEAFAEATPRVDVVVRATSPGEGEIFSDITGELFATPMPASTVARAERVDGVAAAVGVVSGDAGTWTWTVDGRAALEVREHGLAGRAAGKRLKCLQELCGGGVCLPDTPLLCG